VNLQLDMLDPEPFYAVPALPSQLPAGLIGFDFETRDPDLKRLGPGWFPGGQGNIIGFSMAWRGPEGLVKAYWPLHHEGGGNVEDPERHIGWLGEQLKRPDITYVCHNAGYELGWCRRYGLQPAVPFHDTWLMSVTLDDVRLNHSLGGLMRDELGERKQEDLLAAGARKLGVKVRDIKQHLWRLPAPYVATYGEVDAYGSLALAEIFLKKLADEHLEEAYERERRLVGVLVSMRRSGVRVDADRVGVLRTELLGREKDTQSAIKRLIGFGVDVWSADSIAKGFNEQGITDYPKSTKGASFTKEWLGEHPSELAKFVLLERRTNKLRTTFIEGVFMDHLVDGRIFPEINQVKREDDSGGTDTGRMSYNSPNLQFLPARDGDSSQLVRGCIIPDDPRQVWISSDYSQQEPKLTVHFSELSRLQGASGFGDRYRSDPTTDAHQLTADIAGWEGKNGRSSAKILNLAIIYAQGEGTTCRKLGLPTTFEEWTDRQGVVHTKEVPGPEGREVIERYHAAFPFVRDFTDKVKSAVRGRGYVVTLGRRKRRFRRDEKGQVWYSELRKALNHLIQGSAADQTKQAMIDCAEAGYLPKVQVHDELCFSEVPSAQSAIKEIMEGALPLTVPSLVDIAVGPNWGSCV
jgi:DNA polymerase I-like protein with 3'-5' exonuclease and polymerase domains